MQENTVSKQIGRNDPCHCGSGKKYKKCHLALDQQRKPKPEPAPEPDLDEEGAPPLPPNPAQLSKLIQQVRSKAPRKERAELDEILAQSQPLLDYLEHQEEIESASTALEPHREEFERLADDRDAYMARIRVLFDEEAFAPLRFTAADVRRAFEKVGYTPGSAPSDDVFVEKLRAAILHLADKDRRSQLAMKLLLLMPQYVAAGRHSDGWLIQHCAHLTTEAGGESNPFLFQMFSHGYDAWMSELTAKDNALFQEIGLEPARLRSMSMEEIDEWFQAQTADPDRKAKMEALLTANPDQRAAAIAGLERMERDSIKLLEREDAREFLLTQAEIEPSLPELLKRFQALQKSSPHLFSGSPPEETVSRAVSEAIWPAFGEMAQSIFTPERIQQLVTRLKEYRNERYASGDKIAASYAIGALNSLQQEDDPAHNYFLIALCYFSFSAHMKAMAPSESPDENAS